MFSEAGDGEIACVLFDLDGTLVDSRRDIATALDAALAVHRLGPLGVERASAMVGDGVRRLVERAIAATRGDAAIADDLIATYMNAYRVTHLETTVLYPGVANTLADLARRDIACGVVTNKPHEFSVSLLEHLNVRSYFEVVIGGDTLGQRKPDPAPLRVAMAACGATAAMTAMVGDGEADVLAGKAAGVRTVAVTYGFRSAESLAALGPDAMIDAMADLIGAISPAVR